MRLTGRSFKQLRDVLLDAFPTFWDLRSMVRIYMEENLYRMVSQGNYSRQVEELILWAEKHNRVQHLLDAAQHANPFNFELDTIELDFVIENEEAAIDDYDSSSRYKRDSKSRPISSGEASTAVVGRDASHDALIALIPLLQALTSNLQEEEDKGHEFYYEFIEPVWDVFSKVHDNYKVSFVEYIQLLDRPEYPIEDLIEKISRDSIVSEDLRALLAETTQATQVRLLDWRPPGPVRVDGSTSTQDLLHNLLVSISDYFRSRDWVGEEMVKDNPYGRYDESNIYLVNDVPQPYDDPSWWPNNAPRMRVIKELQLSRQSNEPEKRKELADFFVGILKQLQERYQSVARDYQQLRAKLIA